MWGYLGSQIRPSMAILGKQLAWGGSGVATVVPKLGPSAFIREFIHGRPVIFVSGRGDHPYDTLSSLLRFDAAQKLSILLNGNGWLAIAGTRDGEKVFAHVSAGTAGRDALARHEQGLSRARLALMDTTILRVIAAPILSHSEREVSVFAQTHLDGSKIDTPNVSVDEFLGHLLRAAEPIVDIHKSTFGMDIPEQAFLGRMERDLPNLRIEKNLVTLVGSLITEVKTWLTNRKPGAVQVHGDYTLSNVLFDDQGEVSAILDWEWTRELGCAGFDAVFLGVAAAAEKFSISQTALAVDIARSNEIPAPLTQYFQTILPRLDLDMDDLAPLAKLVWLGMIFRSAVWTPPTYDDWLAKAVATMQSSANSSRIGAIRPETGGSAASAALAPN